MALNPAILANANRNGANGGGLVGGGNLDAVNNPDFAAQQAINNSPANSGGNSAVNGLAANSATALGINAATQALQGISDPARFAAANQARQEQGNVANYYGQVATGQSPLVTSLQRQQGQDAAIQAMQAQLLSGQNGRAPGQLQAASLSGLAGAQSGVIGGAQQAAVQEQANALGNVNAAAGAMRTGDINQTLGTGAQQLQGGALLSGLYDANAGRDLAGEQANQGAYVTKRGQDIQSSEAANALAQQQGQFQTQYDQQNNWWNKYAMPGLHAGAQVGAAALAGG